MAGESRSGVDVVRVVVYTALGLLVILVPAWLFVIQPLLSSVRSASPGDEPTEEWIRPGLSKTIGTEIPAEVEAFQARLAELVEPRPVPCDGWWCSGGMPSTFSVVQWVEPFGYDVTSVSIWVVTMEHPFDEPPPVVIEAARLALSADWPEDLDRIAFGYMASGGDRTWMASLDVSGRTCVEHFPEELLAVEEIDRAHAAFQRAGLDLPRELFVACLRYAGE